MCGISGVFNRNGESVDDLAVQRMIATLRHRGPDHQATWTSRHVGLGHARLSILDLSELGHQPMVSDDARHVLVFNGEVYNFRELRRELEALGHPFRGDSDSEVVLAACRQWGADAFARFNGMFAFAYWNAESEELFLVRDRFGIKPLYYYQTASQLAFSSEIKALRTLPEFANSMSWQGLHEFLHYGTTLGETTLYDDVKKVLPGHYLRLCANSVIETEFADIHDVPLELDDEQDAANRIRQELDESVKRHMVSDVPVGIFLSGGIDSTAVTALATKHATEKIQTFSAGFDFDKGVNELPQARRIAQHYGTEHHEIQIQSGEIADVILRLSQHHDVPFGDAANIPLYLLCERLQGQIKVVLQGDGGDEIFAGYHRYSRLQRARWFRLLGPIVRATKGILPKTGPIRRAVRTFEAFTQADESLVMARIMSQQSNDTQPDLVFSAAAQERLRATNPFSRYQQLHEKLRSLDSVQRMLYTDCAILLPDLYFPKVDRATMAHSIEVRVPFVDLNLSKYAMGLPSKLKVRGGEKKWLLRKALRGLVPDFVLDAPKTGFGVPFGYWLQTGLQDLLRETLLNGSLLDQGILDRQQITRHIEEHTNGTRDHSMLLYKLMQLGIWHDRQQAQAGKTYCDAA